MKKGSLFFVVLLLVLFGCQKATSNASEIDYPDLNLDKPPDVKEEETLSESPTFEIIYDPSTLSFDLFRNKEFYSKKSSELDKVMFKQNYRGIFYFTKNLNDETNKIISYTVLNYANINGYYDLINTSEVITPLLVEELGTDIHNALIAFDKNNVVNFVHFTDVDVGQFMQIEEFFNEVMIIFSKP